MCFVYIGTCVPWMAIETKFSKLCISYNLDEYSHAQLSNVRFVARLCDLVNLLSFKSLSLFLTKMTKKILRERHK